MSICGVKVFFTKRQNFRRVKIQSICRRKHSLDSKIEICVGNSRKHCRKMKNCWLLVFSPFPTMFSKAFFFFQRCEKLALCVKGLIFPKFIDFTEDKIQVIKKLEFIPIGLETLS